jgi:hypothetical protein
MTDVIDSWSTPRKGWVGASYEPIGFWSIPSKRHGERQDPGVVTKAHRFMSEVDVRVDEELAPPAIQGRPGANADLNPGSPLRL